MIIIRTGLSVLFHSICCFPNHVFSIVVQLVSFCHLQSILVMYLIQLLNQSVSHHFQNLPKTYHAKTLLKTYLPVSDASDTNISGCLLWIL